MSWKKAKALLNPANTAKRAAFAEQLQALLARTLEEEAPTLVYIDEAHIHQDADLGYGWAPEGERLWVGSHSPGLAAKVSFYGMSLFNAGQVEIWEFPRANTEHTLEVLRRLRGLHPHGELVVLWDGASYHRARDVAALAEELRITLMPLPGYSPDFMPVEALWRWLREEVTSHHCHATTEELIRRVREFVDTINRHVFEVADRLWTKTALDPEEEKLRIPC
jgi:transposase